MIIRTVSSDIVEFGLLLNVKAWVLWQEAIPKSLVVIVVPNPEATHAVLACRSDERY
jgi:hypothetical protein